jgi:hypothetical protein
MAGFVDGDGDLDRREWALRSGDRHLSTVEGNQGRSWTLSPLLAPQLLTPSPLSPGERGRGEGRGESDVCSLPYHPTIREGQHNCLSVPLSDDSFFSDRPSASSKLIRQAGERPALAGWCKCHSTRACPTSRLMPAVRPAIHRGSSTERTGIMNCATEPAAPARGPLLALRAPANHSAVLLRAAPSVPGR